MSTNVRGGTIYGPPPDPVPSEWTLLREAILFKFIGRVTAADLRSASDETPAAFNTQAVFFYSSGSQSSLVGYAQDHTDYNEDHPNNPLNANVDPTHGVWNGMWLALEEAGFTISTWYKLFVYETDETIKIPLVGPVTLVNQYLAELPLPPSQQ